MFQRGEGVDGKWIGDKEQHLNYGERREMPLIMLK